MHMLTQSFVLEEKCYVGKLLRDAQKWIQKKKKRFRASNCATLDRIVS